MDLIVAFAFACNLDRTATLQIGDGTWTLTSIRCRAMHNAGGEFHPHLPACRTTALRATTRRLRSLIPEIDGVRMQTLLKGIQKFDAFGLLDKSFLMWTNHISDGPSHSFSDLPYIIVGNAGGFLKTGQAYGASRNNEANGRILTTLLHATGIQENFRHRRWFDRRAHRVKQPGPRVQNGAGLRPTAWAVIDLLSLPGTAGKVRLDAR